MKIRIENHAGTGIQTVEFEGRMVADFNDYYFFRKIGANQISVKFDRTKYPFEILLDDNEAVVYFHVKNTHEFSFDVFHGKQTLKQFIEA